jgi:transposase InsO family protein
MGFWRKKKKKEEGQTREEKSKERGPKGARKKRFLPLELKLLAIEGREAGMSAPEVSEILGIAPTTIDKWMRVYRAEGSQGLVRQSSSPNSRRIYKELEDRIEEYRREHPAAGVRRIRDELRRGEGLEVSAETVRRVVNDAGLGNKPAPSKRRPPQLRRFERELPNAMWQIDIFTFELKRMYRVYLVGMIDDHSRYMVGHGLFRQQKADAVLEVVKGAIGQWGAPREILSDNGRQFVAWRGKSRFQKVLRQQGVQHVRSAPQHPMTLGKIERFWRTIWEEFLVEANFASFADATQRIGHWVGYYNHQRPHQGIDGACPAERFYGISEDVEEALRQGCKENALRLALGQETRPPLFLLGKLGATDVRVQRKGEDIEVQVGDAVHEVIRLGTPYEAEADGSYGRQEANNDEMAGNDWRGTISGGGAREERGDADGGDLPHVWSEPADDEPGDRAGGSRSEGGIGTEESWEERQERRAADDCRAFAEEDLLGAGARALED